MGIEICAVGGYGEVGKNMTAIKVDDEVIICDMGLHLPNYIHYTEEEGETVIKYSPSELRRVEAIPDDKMISEWKDKAKAILIGHAHLDHVGAVPYLANSYDCPVYGTPFTTSVLKAILKDEKISIRNKIKTVPVNTTLKISKDITVEFINITHSTPQCVLMAIHTKYGVIFYGTDFKLDNMPVLGPKPNYAAIDRAGKKGVILAIINCLYADSPGRTPSESTAKEELNSILLDSELKNNAVIVSTFSSHIARLKSIIECGKKMKRKVLIFGRSMSKYISAAEDVNLVKFSNQAEICRYGRQVKRKLKTVEKDRSKYLIIATGHQGEPKSILSRMTTRQLPFRFQPGDTVLFSCKIIPTELNKAYRKILDTKLKRLGCNLITGAHVSGHASADDLKDIISRLNPKNIIPIHGEKNKMNAFVGIAKSMGFQNNQIRTLLTGQRTKIE